MSIQEELRHPAWQVAGWKHEPVTVGMTHSTKQTVDGLVHPDAPGLALVWYVAPALREQVTIVHTRTGMNAGLMAHVAEPTLCPEAIRDACIAACRRIDYSSLNLSEAQQIGPGVRSLVREPFTLLRSHECAACAWWHDLHFPAKEAMALAYVERCKEAVNEAQAALDDAEIDLDEAELTLAHLRARRDARRA